MKQNNIYIIKLIKNNPKTKFYYIGSSYSNFYKLKKNFPLLQTSEGLFTALSEKYKDTFLHFSKQLNNSPSPLWLESITSRSATGTPLWTDLIHLLSMLQLSTNKHNVVFICDNIFIAYDLSIALKELRYNFSSNFYPYQLFIAFFNTTMRTTLRAILSFYHIAKLWLYSKSLKNTRLSPKDYKITIFRSWFAGNKSETYTDRNFGKLYDYIKQSNDNTWVAPLLFNSSTPYSEKLIDITHQNSQVIIPEQYLNIFDIFQYFYISLTSFFKLVTTISNNTTLNDELYIGNTLWAAILKSSFNRDLLYYNLFFIFIKNKSINYDIKSVIYPFENNPVEKPILPILKSRNIISVGFQHSVWYKDQLSMTILPEESNHYPLPNYIITSGPIYKQVLIKNNFNRTKIIDGPNLRFQNIIYRTNQQWTIHPPYCLQLILTFDDNKNIELFSKLAIALKTLNEDFLIKIRPHPLNNIKQLQQIISELDLQCIIDTSGNVIENVQQSTIAIIPGGSISVLEILVTGIPLIVVFSDLDYNLNPIWEKPDDFIVRSPKKLAQRIQKIISSDYIYLQQELDKQAQHFYSRYFTPVTDKELNKIRNLLV